MSTHLTPSLKFSSIFFTVALSILLVSSATIWAVYEEQKIVAMNSLDQEAKLQENKLKSLLASSVQAKTNYSQATNLKKALQTLSSKWDEDIQNNTLSRYLLVEKSQKSNSIDVLVDVGQHNIPVSIQNIEPAIQQSLTQKNLLSMGEEYYLTVVPIHKGRFGLLILQSQPQVVNIIKSIAPYTGSSILVAIIISWILFKFFQRGTTKTVNQSQARYRQIIENSVDWVWETDKHGNLTYCSEQSFSILGYMPNEMIGKPIFSFLLDKSAKESEQKLLSFMHAGSDISNLEVMYKSKQSQPITIIMSGNVYRDKRNKIIGYRGVGRDITRQKQHHNSIISMAYFDSLTQLPNRTNLIDQLDKHLAEVVQRSELTLSALLFIDLDGFKDVNDTQGHNIGDQLLIELSKRMQNLSFQNSQAYRLAGDEFVILIRCNEKTLMPEFKQRLHNYTGTLLKTINSPMVFDSHNLLVSASIGIALIPQDGRSTSEVLSHADSAMYQAKRDGKNCYRYFDSSMQEIEDRRKQMAREIRTAIENNEFQLHYQLQIDSKNQSIYGMEALIRWPHPTTHALVSPAEFIEVAIEANHIQSIDIWVIKQAVKDIAEFHKRSNKTIPVSINLSAKTLENPELPDLILSEIEKHYIAPADLRLEVTETTLLNNLDKAVESLNILRKKGIQTSIDDFGTGYSSLSYLQTLPVDTLKIDKSFIDKITTSDSDLQICRSIIQLAESLNKNIIAEGVESDIQQQILTSEGCHIIQGYLYAKPQPISGVIQQLAEGATNSVKQLTSETPQKDGILKIVSHL